MQEEKNSVIRPSDIPVEADKHKTVLSPVVSESAVSILIDPLEMGVTSPRGSTYVQPETFREIEERREKVNKQLKKYEEEN